MASEATEFKALFHTAPASAKQELTTLRPSGQLIDAALRNEPLRSERLIPVEHSCECLCQTCERHGRGYFAQLAALAGDRTAACRLAPAIRAMLPAVSVRSHARD